MGALVILVGAALSGGAVNVGIFIVARFIVGWGIGNLICVIRLYVLDTVCFRKLNLTID